MESHTYAVGGVNATYDQSQKKSTILFVLPWSLIHAGGVNQVVINLARQFQRTGESEPIVLITDWKAIDPVWETVHGVRTVRWRIRTFNIDMGLKERFLYWLWEGQFRKKFDTFCSDHGVRVINMHYVGPIAFTLDRLRKSSTRVIPLHLSFHGTDLKTLGGLSKAAILSWVELFRSVTGVIVCSRNLGTRFSASFGESVVPCVIHNGLDASAFTATTSIQPRPIEARYILTVGKFEKQKGQDVLVEAFSEISSDYPDIDLVLVGATSSALSELKELCSRRGISTRVRFYQDKPHDEMAAFFRHAEFFVLPSRLEAFPIVLMEAGAFGLPVIATNVGGIPELITEGVTGRLLPPDASSVLALTMRATLDDPSGSLKMGDMLRRHVSDNFTWKIAGERYLAALLNR